MHDILDLGRLQNLFIKSSQRGTMMDCSKIGNYCSLMLSLKADGILYRIFLSVT